MSPDSKVPIPNESLIDKWTQEIVTSNKLTDEVTVQRVLECIVNYLERKFPDYSIKLSDTYSENGFIVREKKSLSSNPSDWFAILMEKEEELSEDALRIKEIAKEIYLLALSSLGLLNPAKYNDYLEKLDLETYNVPPKYNIELFSLWGDKIIDFFKLSANSSKERIIKKTIIFFDMLYPGYAIDFSKQKDEDRYPVFIDKIAGNYLMWLSVIDQIKKQIYCTHYQILNKFNRIEDCPQTSDFWLELVLVYEELGLPKEANTLGEKGLSFDKIDFAILTELVTYYSEKQRFSDGLKYFKKSGQIFYDQKQYSVALRIYQQVVSLEPDNKSNWIFLEKTYEALGNTKEAQKCRNKYSK